MEFLLCVYAYIWILNIYIYVCLYVSSPYLLVFSDDHVILYTGVDDVASCSSDA